jgi:hypothetical protein
MDDRRNEAGFALASTVVLSGVILIFAAFVVSRVIDLADRIAGDRMWENALQVADSGIDYLSYVITDDPEYTTGHDASSLTTKEDIVAAAGLVDDADVVPGPQGEFVLIVPTTGDVVYSVGFAPSRAEAERIRVVRAVLEDPRWRIEETSAHVLLTGGDLRIEAKKNDKDVELYNARDWAHANGEVTFKKDKYENNVNLGCLTGYANQYSNAPADSNVDCSIEGAVPFVEIPIVDPMELHYLSQYDVCPDGTLRHGPASPAGGVDRALPGSPCTGQLVIGNRGVKNLEKWDKKVEFKDETEEGVYFVWGRSAKIKLEKKDRTRYFTVITAREGNDLTCDTAPAGVTLKKDHFGDVEVEVKERAVLRPHPDGGPYAVVAAGDVKLKLKGKGNDNDVTDDKDKNGTIYGLIAAHEQVKIDSNDAEGVDDYDDDDGFDDPDSDLPKGAVRGVVVAESACDTPGSKVKERSELKKGDLVFQPEYAVVTDFHTGSGGAVPTNRREL